MFCSFYYQNSQVNLKYDLCSKNEFGFRLYIPSWSKREDCDGFCNPKYFHETYKISVRYVTKNSGRFITGTTFKSSLTLKIGFNNGLIFT